MTNTTASPLGIESPKALKDAQDIEASSMIFCALVRAARLAGYPLPKAMRCANQVAVKSTGFDLLGALNETGREQPAGAAEKQDPGSLHEFLSEWRAGGLHLPYTVCRTADLYQAYLGWASVQKISPVGIRYFPRQVLDFMPELARGVLKVEGRNARVFFQRDFRNAHMDGNWGEVAAYEATRFKAALLVGEKHHQFSARRSKKGGGGK